MKKISAEQLYEAMDGIGEDLLLRSEQTQAAKAGRVKRRTLRRVSLAVSALAAILILGFVGLNTLRMGKNATTGSAPAVETHQKADGADSNKAKKQESGTVMESARDEAAEESAVSAPMEAAGATAEPSQPMLSGENSAKEERADAAMEEYAETESLAAGDMAAFFFHDGRQYVESERVPDDGTIVGEYVTSITVVLDERTSEEDYVDGSGSVTGDVFRIKGKEPGEALCMVEEDSKTVLLFLAVDR